MTATIIPFPVTAPEQADAARTIAGLLAPHMSSTWLADATPADIKDPMAPAVVTELRRLERAIRRTRRPFRAVSA